MQPATAVVSFWLAFISIFSWIYCDLDIAVGSRTWVFHASSEYSSFLAIIRQWNYNITEFNIQDDDVPLPVSQDYKESLSADNLIFFDKDLPSIENFFYMFKVLLHLVEHWSAGILESFVKNGGNVIYAIGRSGPPLFEHPNNPRKHSTIQDNMFIFLAQLGIFPAPYLLYDPFQDSEISLSKGFFKTASYSIESKGFLDVSTRSKDLLFTRAFGLRLDITRKNFISSIVSPHWTTLAFEDDQVPPKNAVIPGSELSLIAAFQSSLNSRVVIFGSSYFLSNASLKAKDYANAALVNDLVEYGIRGKNMLKVVAYQLRGDHESVAGEASEKPMKVFRVLDTINFQVSVSMFIDGEWKRPTDLIDLQMEWIMMSPYIRGTLKPFNDCADLSSTSLAKYGCLLNTMSSEDKESSQLYFYEVQIPDKVGIFTLRLHYNRPGMGRLLIEEEVVVRHYSHVEYPRINPIAYPYYLVMIMMMLSAFVFAFVFLYYRERPYSKSSAINSSVTDNLLVEKSELYANSKDDNKVKSSWSLLACE